MRMCILRIQMKGNHMKRTYLNAIVTEKSLSVVNGSDSARILDMISDDPDYGGQIKNVCAKVSVQLSNEVDQICDLLDISKRRFMEAALLAAVAEAKEIMESEGVYDHFEQLAEDCGRNVGESN